jgi:RNA polymerase sigma-70 factor (ECF subfamily)
MFSRGSQERRRFMELTAPHIKLLYNLALRYTGRIQDAEDLVQETLYSAFKNFGQLKDSSKLRGWIIAIMRNRHLRDAQRAGRMTEVDDGGSYLTALESASAGAGPEETLMNMVESGRVKAILDRLPEKHKTSLLLSSMEGLSYKEISEALEMPMGTVMSSISRARAFVKRELLSAPVESTGTVLSLRPRVKEEV